MTIAPLLRYIVDHYKSPAKAAPHVGISSKQVGNILKKPGDAAKVTDETKRKIKSAFNVINPFPLSDHHNITRNQLDALKSQPGSQDLLDKIVEIEGWVEFSDPTSKLVAAGDNYLFFLATFSRAIHHGNNTAFSTERTRLRYLSDAEDAIRKAYQNIEEGLKDPESQREHEKLKDLEEILYLNLSSVRIERSKLGDLSSDELNGILINMRCVEKFKTMIDSKPFMWQAAYNALEITSRLQLDDATMFYFFEKLKEMDPGFNNIDYTPGEVVAIDAEPAMSYFVERLNLSRALHLSTDRNQDC